MKINHVALYVNDLVKMRNFYELYFGGRLTREYHNEQKKRTVSFLIFSEGTYIELIKPEKAYSEKNKGEFYGSAHIGFELKTTHEVDRLCLRLKQNKYTEMKKAHHTQNGFYEAAFLDPEDNVIEITAQGADFI